ncbi:MAG TPA: XRE family transcriptional regulator [Bacillota bacterium]|nr:XRE family transcriptional regulator [Bacillota bacterium]
MNAFTDSGAGPSKLGERLRRLRTNGQIRVRDVAGQCGVSPSFIYQLEQGKVDPSHSTLKSLARALGTSVAVLLGEEIPESWMVVRHAGRRRLVTGEAGVTIQVLPFLGQRSKRMQVLAFDLEPGAVHRQVMFEHEREDLMYLTAGELELDLGHRWLRLRAGDVAHLVLDRPQGLSNPGPIAAQGIWIVSPPQADAEGREFEI